MWLLVQLSDAATEDTDPAVIERSIRGMCKGAEVFVPAVVTTQRDTRSWHYLMSGYAFVRGASPAQCARLADTRYVECVIHRVGSQQGVSDAEVERLRVQARTEVEGGERPISVGDEVQITDSPYKCIPAVVADDLPEQDAVVVLIRLRSTECLVTLPRAFMRRRAAGDPPWPVPKDWVRPAAATPPGRGTHWTGERRVRIDPARLQQALGDKGWSTAQLTAAVSLRRRNVDRWQAGARHTTSASVARRAAAALGVSYEWLTGGDAPAPAPTPTPTPTPTPSDDHAAEVADVLTTIRATSAALAAEPPRSFASAIRLAMAEHDMTPRELGRRVVADDQTVRRWLAGEREPAGVVRARVVAALASTRKR